MCTWPLAAFALSSMGVSQEEKQRKDAKEQAAKAETRAELAADAAAGAGLGQGTAKVGGQKRKTGRSLLKIASPT